MKSLNQIRISRTTRMYALQGRARFESRKVRTMSRTMNLSLCVIIPFTLFEVACQADLILNALRTHTRNFKHDDGGLIAILGGSRARDSLELRDAISLRTLETL